MMYCVRTAKQHTQPGNSPETLRVSFDSRHWQSKAGHAGWRKNMKFQIKLLFALLITATFSASGADTDPGSSNGIAYPTGWQNWATIAVSHRTDNNTIRTILGNEIAVDAARSGNTNPWPEGTVIGKVVWKETALEDWKAAIAPGEFVHAEFMFKDSTKYASTYNWGWARWVGLEQAAFQEGAQTCIACHTPVKDRDWVYTDPAPLP
jgi:hypothetical protein